MVTYIHITYQNYIILNLGGILKKLSKSIDNCKSLKKRKTFFTLKLEKISENKGQNIAFDF